MSYADELFSPGTGMELVGALNNTNCKIIQIVRILVINLHHPLLFFSLALLPSPFLSK